MDRRAVFFLGAAVVSALLIPVTEQAQRWVPAMLAIVYVVLAIASWADKRTRSRGRPDRPRHDGRAADLNSGPRFDARQEALARSTERPYIVDSLCRGEAIPDGLITLVAERQGMDPEAFAKQCSGPSALPPAGSQHPKKLHPPRSRQLPTTSRDRNHPRWRHRQELRTAEAMRVAPTAATTRDEGHFHRRVLHQFCLI